MSKRIVSLCVVCALLLSLGLTACGGGTTPSTTNGGDSGGQTSQANQPSSNDEIIELTMGSWRPDDTAQMNNLLSAYKQVAPNVNITFQPTNPPDYNATLRMQLEAGTGPDLMYARSYATGRELFASGFFADCSDIPGLLNNFSDDDRDPWSSEEGVPFAVPFAAVSHAVYYNKTIFAANNIAVPTTWAEFINVCETLNGLGITPLANGVADEWDILECLFLGMLTNYLGGSSERVKYENGEKPLNSPEFLQAYTDFASLAPYLPAGFEAVTYNDSQAMFATGTAAMFMDGSWNLGVYTDMSDEWGLFSMPAHNAADTSMTFHLDMAIGMNANTKHPEEAKAFLAWLCTQEGATTASENLPLGFFPVIDFPITLSDPHVNEFLQLNDGKTTDVRFVWPVLIDLYTPMTQELIKLLKGDITPQQAADAMVAEVQRLNLVG